jgi:L-seryl-tRNA(Ser) seleniumtransferase
MPASTDLRRRVPSVEQILQEPAIRALEARHGRIMVLRHARRLLEEARELAAGGDEAGLEAALAGLQASLARRIEQAAAPSLIPVINASGVVIHTNLGRAPLPREAAARVAALASSYANLEFDLATGERGDREAHAETRLREIVGAEAAVVVNNNAAAVLLAVNSLAEGREAIVSRGELVEIGGSFRIPDVVRKGGARLREVGTTNKTRLADYAAALSPDTGLILKVHPSNFRIVGFTEAPTTAELVKLARTARVPLVEDLGSGLLAPLRGALEAEPVVPHSLRDGVDLVTFSGDKLLGGPQAGLVVGRKALVDVLRKNPLYRALRVDKLTIAALDAVLAEHEAGRATASIPVLRMLSLDAASVRARAEAMASALRAASLDAAIEVAEASSAVGGGAAPSIELPTAVLSIAHPSIAPDRLAAALRAGRPAVVARVAGDRLLLDLRTVDPSEEAGLREALGRVLSPAATRT